MKTGVILFQLRKRGFKAKDKGDKMRVSRKIGPIGKEIGGGSRQFCSLQYHHNYHKTVNFMVGGGRAFRAECVSFIRKVNCLHNLINEVTENLEPGRDLPPDEEEGRLPGLLTGNQS